MSGRWAVGVAAAWAAAPVSAPRCFFLLLFDEMLFVFQACKAAETELVLEGTHFLLMTLAAL